MAKAIHLLEVVQDLRTMRLQIGTVFRVRQERLPFVQQAIRPALRLDARRRCRSGTAPTALEVAPAVECAAEIVLAQTRKKQMVRGVSRLQLDRALEGMDRLGFVVSRLRRERDGLL